MAIHYTCDGCDEPCDVAWHIVRIDYAGDRGTVRYDLCTQCYYHKLDPQKWSRAPKAEMMIR